MRRKGESLREEMRRLVVEHPELRKALEDLINARENLASAAGATGCRAFSARGKLPQHEPQVKSDIRAVVIGVILYLIFLFVIHPYVFKVPIIT